MRAEKVIRIYRLEHQYPYVLPTEVHLEEVGGKVQRLVFVSPKGDKVSLDMNQVLQLVRIIVKVLYWQLRCLAEEQRSGAEVEEAADIARR